MFSFKNIKVTGDIHNEFNRLLWIQNNKDISKDELLIFAGDCWLFTSPENNNILNDISNTIDYTIAFVDGNHEHFKNLNGFSVKEWCGGKVHFIRNNIIHLMRGQVYSIPVRNEIRKIFTFGGGYSNDKDGRDEGRTWFSEEMPNDNEYSESWENLGKHKNDIDYIITHTCCHAVLEMLNKNHGVEEYPINQFLDDIRKQVNYKHWYFGHLHLDEKVPHLNQTCLYGKVITV